MITTRRATAGDAADLGALLGALGYPAAAEDVARRMRGLDKSDQAILVAEDAGQVVGVAALHRMNVLHADLPVGYITAFVVAERARGSGVGKTLLAAAEAWALEAGCGRLTVTSAEHREGAHRFYPACGLAYTGRRYSKALTASQVPDPASLQTTATR